MESELRGIFAHVLRSRPLGFFATAAVFSFAVVFLAAAFFVVLPDIAFTPRARMGANRS